MAADDDDDVAGDREACDANAANGVAAAHYQCLQPLQSTMQKRTMTTIATPMAVKMHTDSLNFYRSLA